VSASLGHEIAGAMVATIEGRPPPLFAHLIARAFSTALIEAERCGCFVALSDWTEHACERYGELPELEPMLRASPSIARRAFSRRSLAHERLDAGLAVIEASIEQALTRSAGSRVLDRADPEAELEAAIAAFLVRLDGSDPLSAVHSRAVSLWCLRLARRLGMPEADCRFAARGGLLHDVGKTLTPNEILQAPRRLSDEEFAIMREHAAIGGGMVREVERLRPFEPLVRSHHERLDGRGYPDGLHGDEISVGVRIVTVADCFNAMIGRRPYRLPMSPASELEQLVEHRGTQFDPTVVEAMIDIIERPERERA